MKITVRAHWLISPALTSLFACLQQRVPTPQFSLGKPVEKAAFNLLLWCQMWDIKTTITTRHLRISIDRNTLTSNPYDLLLKTIRPAKFLLEINSCLRELCIKSELNFTGADGYWSLLPELFLSFLYNYCNLKECSSFVMWNCFSFAVYHGKLCHRTVR